MLEIYRSIVWLLDHESQIGTWYGCDYQDCLDMADGIMYATKKAIEKRVPSGILEIERRKAFEEN
ncbi:MAG: hypothetical protein J6T96_05275 [Bacteroidales bacterium]|nr:hypothetical protein [Bacteroidales bacterium]